MFQLTQEHRACAMKLRRTLAQIDTSDVEHGHFQTMIKGENPIEEFKQRLFDYIDNVPNTIDSVFWDPDYPTGDEYAQYQSQIKPRFMRGFYGFCAEHNEDPYRIMSEEAKKRGLENILSHRVNGSDPYSEEYPPKFKIEHPEEYLKAWWKYGLSNLASPVIRKRKIDILSECMERYDFDGCQIDFCRHTPFLPIGHQWELRNEVTTFLSDLRFMLLETEKKKNHPMMLFARVPQLLEGAHADGLDIETWIEENIIDGLVIGSRSYAVDIQGYRKATKGRVNLYPCFDYHHCTDGYTNAPIEVLRGVFSNWWQQGADGIMLFNWVGAREKILRATGREPYHFFSNTEASQLCEVGDPVLLNKLERIHVVERRGGYPWTIGFANGNMEKQLPLQASTSGAEVEIYTSDSRRSAELSVVLSHVQSIIKVEMNGIIVNADVDTEWQDDLVFDEAPVSGFHIENIPKHASPIKLWQYKAQVSCHKGLNYIKVYGDARIEKVELLFHEK